MTLTTAIPALPSLLVQLAAPAARALALSVIAALALVAFRVKTTSLRLFTWTAVLYAAIAMPALQWMLPPLPIPAPAFLQDALPEHPEVAPSKLRLGEVFVGNQKTEQFGPKAAGPTEPPAPNGVNAKVTRRRETLSVAAAPATSPSILSHLEWNAVAAGIYLVVASILLARFFVGLAFGHRLLQASQTITDPDLNLKLADRARTAGLARIPRAAESEFISVPLTIGALRSTILLPADRREWDDAKLDAVLAHRYRTLHDAMLSLSVFPCCTARFSGSARSPGGSTSISRISPNRPVTKPPWRVAPTARTTPEHCWDSSKHCTQRQAEYGGRALPWPKQVRLKNE